MPLMMVSPVSSSTCVRNVGSSRVKRCSALLMFVAALLSTGVTARLTTGSGTCMLDSEMRSPCVKVSPLAQSTPNRAMMSPEQASVISSIWLACMRPRRPTLTFLPVRLLKMSSPRRIVPW